MVALPSTVFGVASPNWIVRRLGYRAEKQTGSEQVIGTQLQPWHRAASSRGSS
jgi:hypothetical protein